MAQPKLAHINPNKLVKKNILVDKSLINQPLKGIIITSVINELTSHMKFIQY